MNIGNKVFLDSPESPSSRSIVTYHGSVEYDGEQHPSTFVQLADCGRKISLHKTPYESMEAYLAMLQAVEFEIYKFRIAVEAQECVASEDDLPF